MHLCSALLGDPHTLILDEPVNGLDPEGILWIRNLLKSLAAEGRTVFVSSHLMSEMALTAEQVIIIGKGRLLADVPVTEVVTRAARNVVKVRSPKAPRLRDLLRGPDVTVTDGPDNGLHVDGLGCEQIGQLAADNGIALFELTALQGSLEEAFMELTRDAVEFHTPGITPASVLSTTRSGQS